MDPDRVVVFDSDGTLVHGDSVSGFALEYGLRRPFRVLFMLPLLPLSLLLMLASPTRSAGVSLFWWLLTCGTRTRRLAEALRAYARTTLSRRGNQATLAEFAAHVAAGRTVLIATAAPPLLVRDLLRARGLPVVRVVGTRVRRWFGGFVADPHCIGEMKVHELERRFGLSAWSEAYTDSALDLPLLARARSVVLVSPSRLARARIERALAKDVKLRVVR